MRGAPISVANLDSAWARQAIAIISVSCVADVGCSWRGGRAPPAPPFPVPPSRQIYMALGAQFTHAIVIVKPVHTMFDSNASCKAICARRRAVVTVSRRWALCLNKRESGRGGPLAGGS